MFENSDSSHNIDYAAIFKDIINLEGHPNRIAGSRVTAIFMNVWILPQQWRVCDQWG